MPMTFNANDWYWTVGDDTTKVYSSLRNIYVPPTDAGYLSWLANSGMGAVQNIASESDIWYYVNAFQPWWLWDATTLKMSQPAAGQWTKGQLQNYDTDARTRRVAGGITAAGIPVKTDDTSRGLINTAAAAARADPDYTTTWYGSDGKFYPVDSATMISVAVAVEKHTNDCYAVFAQVSDEITLNTITTTAQIDQAFTGL